jgi:hypothetical protein
VVVDLPLVLLVRVVVLVVGSLLVLVGVLVVGSLLVPVGVLVVLEQELGLLV